MGGKLGGSRLSPPSLTLPLFSKIPQDLVIEQKRYFPQHRCILFYIIGMVGGLICDECECIECVIRQMFSFPDHSGCMSSMALMFHSQWYLSLTIFTNAFPSQKMKCLFLPRSVPVPIFISTFLFPALLQACDLIFWTIDGNLALFQLFLRVEAGVWPWPDPATQTPGLRASRDARDKICIIYTS